MIDAIALGKLLAEEVIDPPVPGPCLCPGKFHPPHIGHFEEVTRLASYDYITEVIVILSAKVSPETGMISPEGALQIWKLYLDAQKNPKIKFQISEQDSPVDDMISIIERNPEAKVIYVAGADDELDDKKYMESVKKKYPGRVKVEEVHEKRGIITSEYVRDLVKNRKGDEIIPDEFKKTLPVAASNKGAIPKVWKILTSTIPSDKGQRTN